MKVTWLFLSSFLCLVMMWYREVNGLGYDDLDFVRSTIKSVAKSITSKTVVSIPRPAARLPSHRKGASLSWGWGIRRRPSYKAMSYSITRPSPPKIVPRNLNKFNEAMDQVERAVTQAELSRRRTKMSVLRKDIINAVNRGNVRFARRALGIALYTARKESKRRGKRSTGYDAKTFLKDIKKDLGNEKFSEFLALQGDVTLMYALDVTGSMGDEIQACKDIIKQISTPAYDRSEPVDYILTTFSDPVGLTTVNYYEEDQVNQLEAKLGSLSATGGGDCPEYSFDGMITALSEDPRWGSPLYVFTDAGPKDADKENKEALRVLADDTGATINFFVGKNFCGSEAQQQPFRDIAEEYGGQYFRLDPSKFSKLAKYTSDSLEGTTPVACGKNKVTRGKRRRRSSSRIAIPVDDTVTKLIVAVVTEHSHSVRLYKPSGRVETSGKTVLSGVVVFSVNNPNRGVWRLVPPSTGKYEYTAKVSSPENIDFEHYFSKKERRKFVPLRNPLSGQSVQVSLTVSGASKTQKSSLLVDIIDIAGNTLMANKRLTEVGKSGIRFTFNLVPPSKAFKLLLKGRTKAGSNFQRISRHVDSSKPLVIKEFYTSKHYTIPQKGSTFVIFYLFNGLSRQKTFNVSFKTRKGYTASLYGSSRLASRMKVRGNSKKFLRVNVRYTGGTPAKIGDSLNVVMIVKGRDNSFITTEVVPLMIT